MTHVHAQGAVMTNRHKIVILDDSDIVRDLMRDALEPRYEVITVESPIGFSNLLKREQPSLALVDVNMPTLRGDKLVEMTRRRTAQDCAIVLFSDLPENTLQQMARESGADGYIRKSSDLGAIVRRIDQLTRRA
jgi:DNA-binding response OmpR family regulator